MAEPATDPSLLAHLRRAVDASGEIVFLTDANGLLTFVNAQFTKVYGYTPEEVVGRVTPRILKSGVLGQQDYAGLWQTLLQGQAVTLDLVNRTKDGRLVTIESSANPISDERGIVVGFFAVQRDVTARRALDERYRLAQSALDHAGDAIFWVQQDGRIRYVNEAAVHLLGYSRDELCAMKVADIDPDFTVDRYAEHFREGLRNRAVTFESRQRKRDGTVFPVDVTVSYQDVDGQPCGCAIVRDLTERRQLEDQFRQSQKMEAIGRLAGGIAHDFNNLLTAILGFSELILERVHDDAGLREDVEEIKKAGERAGRLTRQLLAFSRQQMLAPKVVDLNQVVGDVQKMLGRVLGEDIRLELVSGSLLDPTKVDPGQIEQLLMNLIVNARDAMPKGGRITITTENVDLDADFVRHNAGAVPGPHVALRVTDTGFGMPRNVLAHVFEPFFTTKPVGKGTGLGLSTVYGIVKQSGGFITIESHPGMGTTVTSYFPRVAMALESLGETAGATRSVRGVETILLVEDDGPVRDLARKALERQGYTVLPAADAAEAMAIEAVHADPIHLLLSDVVMPGLNGPDLAQRLVRRRPSLKVLYVSGFAHHLAVASGSVSTRTAFLQKPFTPEILTLKVRDTLDRPVGQNVGPR